MTPRRLRCKHASLSCAAISTCCIPQLVDSIVESIEGELWAQWGLRSPEHWLSWHTGLSPAHAKQLVDTARRKAELPTTFAALADGELSIDQVATIAKHVPSHNDGEACELAKSATVA